MAKIPNEILIKVRIGFIDCIKLWILSKVKKDIQINKIGELEVLTIKRDDKHGK